MFTQCPSCRVAIDLWFGGRECQKCGFDLLIYRKKIEYLLWVGTAILFAALGAWFVHGRGGWAQVDSPTRESVVELALWPMFIGILQMGGDLLSLGVREKEMPFRVTFALAAAICILTPFGNQVVESVVKLVDGLLVP